MNAARPVPGDPARRPRRRAALIASLSLGLLATGIAAQFLARAGAPRHVVDVSQQGRAFRPGVLSIGQGDRVRIVNDDEDLTHHAYIASDRFSFDSGDQAPGRDVNIDFATAGTFNVLCGIHPKMRLTVTVR